MKKVFLILLFVLSTCATIEESFDDNVVLEKSKTNPFKPPKKKFTTRVTSRHTTKHTTKLTTKLTSHPTNHLTTRLTSHLTSGLTSHLTSRFTSRFTTYPTTKKLPNRQTLKDLLKFRPKGINGLFKGKVGEVFRKLGEAVKKGIAWLKQNKLWDPLVDQLRNLGEKYGNEFCQKVLPEEVCGHAVDFVLNHVLGKPAEQN